MQVLVYQMYPLWHFCIFYSVGQHLIYSCISIEVSPAFSFFADETQQFTIQVKPAKNYPVDLYYLMDLSKSMSDDKEKLTTLGTSIG